MASILYSASLKTVKASCGHNVQAFIPPHGGRVGRKGMANIAEAQIKPCRDCRIAAEDK